MANFEVELLENEATRPKAVLTFFSLYFSKHFPFFKFFRTLLSKKPYGFENDPYLHSQNRTCAFGAQPGVKKVRNRVSTIQSENSNHFLSNAVSIVKNDPKLDFLHLVKVGPYSTLIFGRRAKKPTLARFTCRLRDP